MSGSRVPLALVVGAGGLGCPAAWALAQTGRWRMRIVDHDAIELSNLPRQVLYGPLDVDKPKAEVAARRLTSRAGIEGVRARLDASNHEAFLDDVDVVIDATDGARTKDWLNQLAVRTPVPLVHAAGLRSEARLMAIPRGGAPCLSCVFGRLEEESGRCSDLGVWNGVVGAAGFLAAHRAELLVKGQSNAAYDVLDLASGRALSLGTRARDSCPVCGQNAREAKIETFPEPIACERLPSDTSDAPALTAERRVDLSGERCPMNLLRARQSIEHAPPGTLMEFLLGQEGAATVPDGVRMLGHQVVDTRRRTDADGIHLVVRVSATPPSLRSTPPRMPAEVVQRFARQLVLDDMGSSGQQALFRSSIRVGAPSTPLLDTALIYLAAAGVGSIALSAAYERSCSARQRDHLARVALGVVSGTNEPVGPGISLSRGDGNGTDAEFGELVADLDAAPSLPVSLAMARGALVADRIQRRLVDPSRDPRDWITISDTGDLMSTNPA